MQDYASYVKDDMISELCDLSRDLMLSIDILPVPTDEAVRLFIILILIVVLSAELLLWGISRAQSL